MISVGKPDEVFPALCMAVKNSTNSSLTLGVDLDGTIDEAPEFFATLMGVWPGRVIIITCRNDKAAAIARAKQFGVYFDEIVLVRKLEDKAAVIRQLNVNVYVDDQDECLMDIPSNTTVLKIRNGGNFKNRRWLYSKFTGKQI